MYKTKIRHRNSEHCDIVTFVVLMYKNPMTFFVIWHSLLMLSMMLWRLSLREVNCMYCDVCDVCWVDNPFNLLNLACLLWHCDVCRSYVQKPYEVCRYLTLVVDADDDVVAFVEPTILLIYSTLLAFCIVPQSESRREIDFVWQSALKEEVGQIPCSRESNFELIIYIQVAY